MIHIYGVSDDLLEISGDQDDEINLNLEYFAHVHLSDGTIMEIVYDVEGFWRFTKITGSAQLTITAARGEGETDDIYGCPGYSERVDLPEVSVNFIYHRGERLKVAHPAVHTRN